MKAGEFYHFNEENGMPIYSGKVHFIKESVRQTLCGINLQKFAIDYQNEINVNCKRCLKKKNK